MHQQIPSMVQDMSLEFDAMHSEYKQLEMELGTEVKPSFRRKHVSKMRDIKVGTKRLDKLMNSLLNMQTAFKTMISEVPIVDGVVLALGASPLRPQHIYVLNFSSARLMMILRGVKRPTLFEKGSLLIVILCSWIKMMCVL
ncbi:hypothetical protein AAZX31_19G141600 [Glycine max]|uniref:Uncharacterized protein n=2 Tax=Glycine max TaxID=3847 RepID=K7MYK1_SOYBN|nr:hypothetical protein GYH30_053167 [Glycine max]KRG95512.1 hypothetical protein GLYMA_19G155400v4 [Glycine max]